MTPISNERITEIGSGRGRGFWKVDACTGSVLRAGGGFGQKRTQRVDVGTR
jgi:hypothetical protein